MLRIVGFLANFSKISVLEDTEFHYLFADSAVFFMFLFSVCHERLLKNLLNITFSERTKKDLSGALKCFGETVANVLLSLAKNRKNDPFFDISMIITPGVSSFILRALSEGISSKIGISFLYFKQDIQNSVP